MPDLEVRAASDRDIEAVEPLVADALGRLQTLRGGPSLLSSLGVAEDASATEIARIVCVPAAHVAGFVATLDGAVVGVAACVRAEGRFDLVGVHTARSLRRRRIGTELLGAARAAAEVEGARFEALALPGDQTVKSLLEASGFKARLLRMSADR